MKNLNKTALLLAVLFIGLLGGCTSPTDAQRVLESSGYSNVQMHGYDWFNCSKDDTYSEAEKICREAKAELDTLQKSA